MNRLKSAMFAVLVTGSAVALGAQGEATDKAATSPNSGKTAVTVTGCVATGTQAGQYVLTNAAVVPDAKPVATGTSGAAVVESPTSMESTTSYALKGGDLKAHVGHKVEVTGTTWQANAGAKEITASPATPSPDAATATPSTPTATATPSPDAATATPQAATTAPSTPRATLEVNSVNMISTTCP
jgi:hypothetical protein